MMFSLTEAESLVAETLEKNRVSAENARSVARALVTAEAAGQGGHGLRRIEAYSLQARAGKADGFATPVFSTPRPSVLRVDAAFGFAYPAIDQTVPRLADMARQQGIAIAAISRSHHAGVLGLTVERFADEGLVALMVANAPASMAPWGGRKPLFGTNPIAFAAPVAGDDPLVIDMALSTVARGKIMAAVQKGDPIPPDWAFGPDGQPTTDAKAGLAGTMMPAGGAKGAALAMMVEVLAAGLTGAQYSYQSSSLFDDKGAPPALGHTIITIDPTATGGSLSHLSGLAQEIAADEGARIPGRRGINNRRQAIETGIDIPDDVMATIKALQG